MQEISKRFVYPANFAEQRIQEAYATILNADEVTKDMIPPLCHYIIFSKDGEKNKETFQNNMSKLHGKLQMTKKRQENIFIR